jgi:hypothetical protein
MRDGLFVPYTVMNKRKRSQLQDSNDLWIVYLPCNRIGYKISSMRKNETKGNKILATIIGV